MRSLTDYAVAKDHLRAFAWQRTWLILFAAQAAHTPKIWQGSCAGDLESKVASEHQLMDTFRLGAEQEV